MVERAHDAERLSAPLEDDKGVDTFGRISARLAPHGVGRHPLIALDFDVRGDDQVGANVGRAGDASCLEWRSALRVNLT